MKNPKPRSPRLFAKKEILTRMKEMEDYSDWNDKPEKDKRKDKNCHKKAADEEFAA